MERKTDYTWEDVGDAIKADGSVTTQAAKEEIAKRWNERNKAGGVSDQNLSVVMRAERNALLHQSDWTQLDDVPQKIKEKYKSWRQELRDLPQQAEFPHITIPGEPE